MASTSSVVVILPHLFSHKPVKSRKKKKAKFLYPICDEVIVAAADSKPGNAAMAQCANVFWCTFGMLFLKITRLNLRLAKVVPVTIRFGYIRVELSGRHGRFSASDNSSIACRLH